VLLLYNWASKKVLSSDHNQMQFSLIYQNALNYIGFVNSYASLWPRTVHISGKGIHLCIYLSERAKLLGHNRNPVNATAPQEDPEKPLMHHDSPKTTYLMGLSFYYSQHCKTLGFKKNANLLKTFLMVFRRKFFLKPLFSS
jgi:hypothetical protein